MIMAAQPSPATLAAEIVSGHRALRGLPAGDAETVMVPIASIRPSYPTSPAKVLMFARLATAAPPVQVRRDGNAFGLLDGHHRVAAARARGETHVSAIVGTNRNTKSGPAFFPEMRAEPATPEAKAAAEILSLYRSHCP